MDYYEIVGLVVIALIAIAGFFISIRRLLVDEKKPLEELNINIAKLNTNFEHIIENDKVRDRRINKHGEEIDELVDVQRENEKKLDNHEMRLGRIEKKIDI